MPDLFEVIEDSISDAVVDEPTPAEAEPAAEVVPETPETPVEAIPEETPAVEDVVASPEVPSPAAPKQDDFAKAHGLAPQLPGARENRLPYGRVKKIAEKAGTDAAAATRKEFEPQLAERDAKIKNYEVQLGRVSKFEEVMVKDAEKFLRMLATLPAYKDFFTRVDAAFAAPPGAPATVAQDPGDEMPQPNQELSDGTKVYDMEGLNALQAWNRAQARKETLAEVEKVYGPIAKEYEATQKERETDRRVQAAIPHVRAKIETARTWKGFNDNEAEIVKALQDDQNLSLEGAYMKVVLPKLEADEAKIRDRVLQEIKAAPRSTSTPGGGTKPVAHTSTGPRDLTDVINDSIKSLSK